MIVPIKNKDGVITGWRTAYVGYIKNNFMRRVAMISTFPITLILVFIINLLRFFVYTSANLIVTLYMPFKSTFKKWECWDKPRK